MFCCFLSVLKRQFTLGDRMAQDTWGEFLPLNTVFDSSYTIFLVLSSNEFLNMICSSSFRQPCLDISFICSETQLSHLSIFHLSTFSHVLNVLNFSSKNVILIIHSFFKIFCDHNTNQLLLQSSLELTKQTCTYIFFFCVSREKS